MAKYKVYFEIFGKKLVVEIAADSEEQAKYMVIGKIKWHKIERSHNKSEIPNIFKEIFGS
jgi:hypothetical protein